MEQAAQCSPVETRVLAALHGGLHSLPELVSADAEATQWVASRMAQPVVNSQPAEICFVQNMTSVSALQTTAIVAQLRLMPGNRVLEIGFGGSGGGLLEVADLLDGEESLVAGLDISASCCDHLRQLLAANKSTNHEVHCSNVNDPFPFEDNSFTHVFHHNAWYFWPDLDRTLAECLRVLQPGGRMLSGSTVAGIPAFFGSRLPEVRSFFKNTDLADYEAALSRAGFDTVQTQQMSEGQDDPLAVWTVTESTKAAGEERC